MTKQPFYLLNPNPWPIILSLNLFNLINSMIFWMSSNNMILLMINLFLLLMSSLKWWVDIKKESMYIGIHSYIIYMNLKMGFIIFIMTEILVFSSLLINFFYNKFLNYDMMWPPKFIKLFNPYEIPLLNTFILFSSSMTITWAHHCLLLKNKKNMKTAIYLTLMLGNYFMILQIYEFISMKFNINDSIYGHSFFLTTGFHGLHVIIGLIFITSFLNKMKYMSPNHHFNFESAAWYWHFVDLVWLFVFTSLYL
uniref:Cytochrome c oxidase subunit 3 n=1 Tax=Xenos yangi TaxID=2980483 RepID=A0A977LJU6_9NEOP|nr:cytochrome c oxidase subunit 3 [Xenos yangi]